MAITPQTEIRLLKLQRKEWSTMLNSVNFINDLYSVVMCTAAIAAVATCIAVRLNSYAENKRNKKKRG